MEGTVIENLKTVCLCKNIKKGTLLRAVHGGCRTMEEVNRKVGSGSGDCKGVRCGPKIMEMIEKFSSMGIKE